MAEAGGSDFFISYTGVNRPWAEWIAVELERAGYTTVLQAWDFRPGTDFLHKMQEATTAAGRTIAVLSPAYFGSDFGEAEWRAAFAKDPSGERGLLVPVRVQPCEPPGLLATRVYVDLVDLDEAGARRRLLAAVDRDRPRPATAAFPGPGDQPRFPGLGPRVSNLPTRNRRFSGRAEVLERLHGELRTGSTAAVVPTGALHGMGGVGKTQLALEYAHRFASDYDVIWWIAAEQPTSAVAALAALAGRLGVPSSADQAEMAAGLLELLRGRDRWLLLYDNAERPDQLAGLLPAGGGGHVVVTSRWSAWAAQASPLALSVLARPESVEFLRRRTGFRDDEALGELAELVGDLPLALEEAAAYLDETKEDLGAYLELVRDRSRELFGLDNPAAGAAAADRDSRRVATVWSVSLDRVHEEAPAAEALLNLLAFLAPEVPRALPAAHPGALPDLLGAAVGDRLAYNRVLAVLGRYSLATVDATVVGLHRLVQAVIRARLSPADELTWAAAAVGLVGASFPDESWEVETWPLCERLLPQVIAVAEHAERLGVAGATVGWLLDRASTYLRGRGQYGRARSLAERAVAAAEAALGADAVEVAWRRDELGRVLLELRDSAGAREQFERAVAIGEVALGPDDTRVAAWRHGLGKALRGLGDLDGARAQHELALAIDQAARGEVDREVGVVRSDLGRVLWDQGDLAGAREQFERAVEISEAALGPDHHYVAVMRANLGAVLWDLGDLAGAREQLERAVEIGEAALGPDHPSVGISRHNLGDLLRVIGDLAGAREQFQRAVEIDEQASGPDHPDYGVSRRSLDHVLELLREQASHE